MKSAHITKEQFYRLVSHLEVLGEVQVRHTLKVFEGTWGRDHWLQARNQLILAMLGEAGLRLAELLRVRWIDLVDGGRVRPYIEVQTSKRVNHSRKIGITGLVQEAADRLVWLDKSLLGEDYLSASVFRVYGSGRSLGRRQVQRFIARLGRDCMGCRLWPHALRHTYATRMMRACDIRTVQSMLGHQNLSTTMRYTHPDLVDILKASDKMDVDQH